MHERRSSEDGDGVVVVAQDLSRGGCEVGASAAVAGHVRRLQVDEVGHHEERLVQRGPPERPMRLGLELEDGVPRVERGQPLEPGCAVGREQVGQLRVVGPPAAFADGLERRLRREPPAVGLHVVTDVDDPHRQRDLLAAGVLREARAVPSLEREAKRSADIRVEAETCGQHVGHLAPGAEVEGQPVVDVLPDDGGDLLVLLRRPDSGGERDRVPQHLVRVRRVVDQGLGADGEVVVEELGDLVRVSGAAQVAQQCHPVRRAPQLAVDAGRLAHPVRQQAGPELRLEGLPERVVLGQSEGGDELTEAQGRFSGRHQRPPVGSEAPGPHPFTAE